MLASFLIWSIDYRRPQVMDNGKILFSLMWNIIAKLVWILMQTLAVTMVALKDRHKNKVVS